jgi:hypothetical protein
VPTSLKRMIEKYNVSYPITLKRIEFMQKIAKRLGKRFYGYRSSCITTLVTAFTSSQFSTHEKARTTA